MSYLHLSRLHPHLLPLLDNCLPQPHDLLIASPSIQDLVLGSRLQQDIGAARCVVLMYRLPYGRERSSHNFFNLPQGKIVDLGLVDGVDTLLVTQSDLGARAFGPGIFLHVLVSRFRFSLTICSSTLGGISFQTVFNESLYPFLIDLILI